MIKKVSSSSSVVTRSQLGAGVVVIAGADGTPVLPTLLWIEALNRPTGIGVAVATIGEVEDVLTVTGDLSLIHI